MQVSGMNEEIHRKGRATLFLGCPEVPVQMGISLYLSYRLVNSGWTVTVAANPSVIKLARVSDPERHYIGEMVDLDRYIGDFAEKKKATDLAVAFAHNEAGMTYAATIRYLHPGPMVLVVLGREAGELATHIDYPCDQVVEKAVHNPGGLKKKLDEVFGWSA